MLSKRASDVAAALESIIDEAGTPPSNIYADDGSEWKGETAALFKKYKIGLFIGRGPNKAAVVERWNKTIVKRLYKYMAYRHTRQWALLLQQIVKNYNASKHSTIGRAPNSITFANQYQFYKTFYHPQYKKLTGGDATPKFAIGDRVVIRLPKAMPLRGYDRQFGYEEYRVSRIFLTSPVRYELKDAQGVVSQRRYLAGEISLVRWSKNQSDYHELEVLRRRIGDDGKEEAEIHFLADPKAVTRWIPSNRLKNIQR